MICTRRTGGRIVEHGLSVLEVKSKDYDDISNAKGWILQLCPADLGEEDISILYNITGNGDSLILISTTGLGNLSMRIQRGQIVNLTRRSR